MIPRENSENAKYKYISRFLFRKIYSTDNAVNTRNKINLIIDYR